MIDNYEASDGKDRVLRKSNERVATEDVVPQVHSANYVQLHDCLTYNQIDVWDEYDHYPDDLTGHETALKCIYKEYVLEWIGQMIEEDDENDEEWNWSETQKKVKALPDDVLISLTVPGDLPQCIS